MSTEKESLDISYLQKLMKDNLNKTELQQLDQSLQSIAKRIEYCKYHYNEFINNTNANAKFLDGFGKKDSNEISIRTIYEANTIAFMQNLHASIDSLPYALNIIFRKHVDIEDRRIGWNNQFISNYKSYPFYKDLEKMASDEIFSKIKGFVNRTKHKHLVRIKNNLISLTFDDFSYEQGKTTNTIKNQDVNLFMITCHDDLIPKFLTLYNLIIDEVKKGSK